MTAKELDKQIIAAAHDLLTKIQEVTHETDKYKLVIIAIGALLNVAKAFGCSTFAIMMQVRRILGY